MGYCTGDLKIKKKNLVIKKYREGVTDILVSTPVIEVGIDIANANIIVIENADHFGLAQLHQLRGRIGRGNQKAYCLLFSESITEKTQERLSALIHEHSGFKLAEIDLALRGPGELFGTAQHGLTELKIASWQDTMLLKQARLAAVTILS